MPLSKEQIKELKTQLSKQIQHLPPQQRETAQKQINEMSSEALEEMLAQQQSQPSANKQIYRAIVSGEIPAKKIDENSAALAVLEIKPISKGHIIIIPKIPCNDSNTIPTQAFNLAKKISKKLMSKLKAKGAEIQTQFAFEEMIINVIPIYDKPLSLNSPRSEISENDLTELYILLRTKPKPKVIKIKKSKKSKIIKLKRRIP